MNKVPNQEDNIDEETKVEKIDDFANDCLDNYERSQDLGQGSYGDVFMAINKRNQTEYAIKMFKNAMNGDR